MRARRDAGGVVARGNDGLSRPFHQLRRNTTVIEKSTEFDERLDCRRRSGAMLVEHLSLCRGVATEQRTDQQTVMLIEFLQRQVGGPVQFNQSLLTATAEQ